MKLDAIFSFDFLRLANEAPDAIFCACGYEQRAVAIAVSTESASASRRIAFGFHRQKELAYCANAELLRTLGFTLFEGDDDAFGEDFRRELAALCATRTGNISIVVDISCLNRRRLAHVVDGIRTARASKIDAVFVYSIAAYTPPPLDNAPTVTVEPVLPQFSGWTTQPAKPPAAILGLGYEPFKAIGVVDHLEINDALWAFMPDSPERDYLPNVNEANQSLLGLISLESRKQLYALTDPVGLFHEMNSLVDALKRAFNPLVIPFGPKLFALVSLLVACVHDDLGVWRVSSGELEPAVDRKASGHFVAVGTSFVHDIHDTSSLDEPPVRSS